MRCTPAWALCGALLFAVTRVAEAAAERLELVLSHYAEDISWINDLPLTPVTVYSKSKSPPIGAIPLPNIGRESHSYLHHIVSRYDSLAEWTVFSQAIRPTWGYHGAGTRSGHLSDAVTFDDYLRPFPDGKDSFFVLTAASQFPSGRQTNRLGFMIQHLKDDLLSKNTCPAGGPDGWTPWWWSKDHPQLRPKNASEPTMLEFYHKYIAQDDYDDKPLTLAFVQGARFSVSRSRIHQRPREFYEALLKEVSKSKNPMAGYWMEASWYDVFHPEALQSKTPVCALPKTPEGPALSKAAFRTAITMLANDTGLVNSTARSLSTSYSYSYSYDYDDEATEEPDETTTEEADDSTTQEAEDTPSGDTSGDGSEKTDEVDAALSRFGLRALAVSVASVWAAMVAAN